MEIVFRYRFWRSFREWLGHETTQKAVLPFVAVLDGRQKLQWKEFLRPSQLGICIAVGAFWWAHRFISVASEAFLSLRLPELMR